MLDGLISYQAVPLNDAGEPNPDGAISLGYGYEVSADEAAAFRSTTATRAPSRTPWPMPRRWAALP